MKATKEYLLHLSDYLKKQAEREDLTIFSLHHIENDKINSFSHDCYRAFVVDELNSRIKGDFKVTCEPDDEEVILSYKINDKFRIYRIWVKDFSSNLDLSVKFDTIEEEELRTFLTEDEFKEQVEGFEQYGGSVDIDTLIAKIEKDIRKYSKQRKFTKPEYTLKIITYKYEHSFSSFKLDFKVMHLSKIGSDAIIASGRNPKAQEFLTFLAENNLESETSSIINNIALIHKTYVSMLKAHNIDKSKVKVQNVNNWVWATEKKVEK